MSLKAFHLVFIIASIALALGCGAWWLREFFAGHAGVGDLISGLLAIGVALALISYERYFLKKLKNVHYL